jgi:hypothetical protein
MRSMREHPGGQRVPRRPLRCVAVMPSGLSYFLIVFRANGSCVRRVGGELARGTLKVSPRTSIRETLENRALAALVATCAEVIRWLAVAHRFLKRADHTSCKRQCQLVALLLGFPVFHASDLLFELAYFLNQRRLRRVRGEQVALGVENQTIQLNGFGLNLGRRFRVYQALRNPPSSSEAGSGRH